MGLAYAGTSRAGPSGPASADSRAALQVYFKEAAQAPAGAAAAEGKRSAAQSSPAAPEAQQVPVVQAESVPDREPSCCKQLLEYIGCGGGPRANRLSGFSVDASVKFRLNRDQHAE